MDRLDQATPTREATWWEKVTGQATPTREASTWEKLTDQATPTREATWWEKLTGGGSGSCSTGYSLGYRLGKLAVIVLTFVFFIPGMALNKLFPDKRGNDKAWLYSFLFWCFAGATIYLQRKVGTSIWVLGIQLVLLSLVNIAVGVIASEGFLKPRLPLFAQATFVKLKPMQLWIGWSAFVIGLFCLIWSLAANRPQSILIPELSAIVVGLMLIRPIPPRIEIIKSSLGLACIVIALFYLIFGWSPKPTSPDRPGKNNTREVGIATLTTKGGYSEKSPMDDAALAQLTGRNDLQNLNLNKCNITDDGLVHLEGLKDLQGLDLSLCHNITDASLVHLEGLGGLQYLNLSGCEKITGAGLAHLTELKNLQELDLFNCYGITDVGLVNLAKFKGLQKLCLSKCAKVTDAGLTHLAELKGLQKLMLSESDNITDSVLSHLAELKGLHDLELPACHKITDAGLAHLAGLKDLQRLDLSFCHNITDDGLVHLEGLKGLQNLNLTGCEKITDAGLAHLTELKDLQVLELDGTPKVTAAGIADLKKALPTIEVRRRNY